MKSIFKSAIFAVLTGLFLMQIVSAQDKGGDASTTKDAPVAVNTTKESKIVFPDVEGWVKGQIDTYPTPELGYSIGYQSREGGTVTVYVYNGGHKNIPNGITDNLPKGEIEIAKDEINAVGRMGIYPNLKEIKNDSITLGGSGGKVKSLYTLFNFKLKGTVMTSEIYLFGYNNNFIKIRATRPKEAEGTVNKALANLLAAFDEMFSK